MHDRSVFSARISVCISSVAREAADFAPPVALSPAVLASPIALVRELVVGGNDGGGEVVACCSARWRSLSCSSSAKNTTDDVGGGAVYSGCKLWPSAV